MIYRKRPAAPPSLEAAEAAELALAVEHYAKPDPSKFTFKAYKDETAAEILNALFSKKCAYCESRYKAVHPMDVEHYRPKGRVVLPGPPRSNIRGYWWLAAAWENLLPSCIFCNRPNTQTTHDTDIVSGKSDLFPLFNEAARATDLGGEKGEDPVLLNPCDCDPSAFFRFEVDSGRAIILPASEDPSSRNWERSFQTIKILGLNRDDLAEERFERMMLALGTARRSIRLARLADNACDEDQKAALIDEAETAMAEVKTYTSDDAPYAAAARAVVAPELNSAGIKPPWSASSAVTN